MHPDSYIFRIIPENLAPMINHTSGPRRVKSSKIIQTQICVWHRPELSFPRTIEMNISFGNRKIHRTIPGIHHQRSEEHTSELQSRENLVCSRLLEKKI